MKPRQRTQRLRHAAVIAFLGCLLAAAYGANDIQTRDYKIPKLGVLHLRVPVHWDETVERHGKTPPVDISYQTSNHDFEYYVSAIWNGPRRDLKDVREFVEKTSDGLLSEVVETEIALQEVIGEHASGYYFAVTDKNPTPTPDDFKFMTQGLIRLDGMELTFTVLTNSKNTPVIEDALAVVRTAKFTSKR